MSSRTQTTAAVFHSNSHTRCPLLRGGNRHHKVAIGNACGLFDLPMNPCWEVQLTIVAVRPILSCHIKLEVTDLAVEIALVNIPLSTVVAGNTKV
jgi:hypothetical protein